MAVTLTNVGNYNLLDPTTWTAGSGSVGVFGANGDAGEQNRYVGTDPWGNANMVWQTVPSGNNGADGGWNTNQVAIDQTKLYRFSVWVKRTSATSSGTFYFGIQSNLGQTTSLSTDQGGNGNPYWQYIGAGGLTQNVWYLYVGHCYPVNYNGATAHPDSGYYVAGSSVKSGANAGNISFDCPWTSGTTSAVHRTYHYYCADSTTRLEFFWPRIDLVDNTQPSIQQLMTAYTPPECVIFSDGTKQTTKFDSTVDSGNLINVQQFAATGTWTKPAGCKTVLVKLAGGGGGAAGSCESGGGGGYSEKVVDVTTVSTVAVTVGGGGASIAYYGASNNGGTTSFGSYCSATGGYGANNNASHSGGIGGVGSSGTINLLGGIGSGHTNSSGHYTGGRGGGSFFGSSGMVTRNSTSSKLYNGAPGAGGPGARTDDGGGGVGVANGESGIVVVYSYS